MVAELEVGCRAGAPRIMIQELGFSEPGSGTHYEQFQVVPAGLFFVAHCFWISPSVGMQSHTPKPAKNGRSGERPTEDLGGSLVFSGLASRVKGRRRRKLGG